eukprot:scaffold5026_cov143-Pinguiococcus_pyrenoidosus.AAC.1
MGIRILVNRFLEPALSISDLQGACQPAEFPSALAARIPGTSVASSSLKGLCLSFSATRAACRMNGGLH